MTDGYRPYDFPLYGIYGSDFWNVIYQNIYQFFWNTLTLGFTNNPSSYRFRIVKWCGNLQCNSLIKYYPDERPSSCDACKKKINWE